MEGKNSVLIVDDSALIRMKLADILKTDYKVYMAEDGTSALLKANEFFPDLILLDVVMPGMNGFDVLAALKKSKKTRDIPVVFITGATNSDDEIKGLAAGAADYICKPLNDTIVTLRVRQQIRMLNLFRKVEQLSMSDQLTNLPNRRSFEQRIQEEWKRSTRDQTPLSILVVDIDNFKDYNDMYGHQQGDAILQEAAKTLSRVLKRPGDFSARWGGEEFVILLCNTDTKGAIEIAEQVRGAIETTMLLAPDGKPTSITVSVGVNTRTAGGSSTIDEFISKADKALYEAKGKGRNKVCFFKE